MSESREASAQRAVNEGYALLGQKRFIDALNAFDTAIGLAPDLVHAHASRGLILNGLKRHSEALAAYHRALQIDPEYAFAHHNQAMVLIALDDLEGALAGIDRAIALRPSVADFHVSRGNVLKALGRFDQARQGYETALSIDPALPRARQARAALRLLQGDLVQGFEELEAIRAKPAIAGPEKDLVRFLALSSEDRIGKTVLLDGERGLGDTIQYCRYTLEIGKMGARVLLAPQARLKALMRSLGPGAEIIDPTEKAPSFDYRAGLMSLPQIMRTDLDSVPATTPYLAAQPDRMAHWAPRLGGSGFRIGVCWQGGTAGGDDWGRSFPASVFAGLASVPGVRLISLHKGEGESQLAGLPGGTIESLGAQFDDGPDGFLDTAAAIKLCDLIVTSDTAVAHLAGALGAPVWLALQHVPEFRWLLERSDTPWYPTMTLYRQSVRGDWAGPFGRMERDLRARPN
jgi:tetratricopeptide (TPR) repeat protein